MRIPQALKQAYSQGYPESAMHVQVSIGSRNSAIHNDYHTSLRPSSLFEPRHPSLKVVSTKEYGKGETPMPKAITLHMWRVINRRRVAANASNSTAVNARTATPDVLQTQCRDRAAEHRTWLFTVTHVDLCE